MTYLSGPLILVWGYDLVVLVSLGFSTQSLGAFPRFRLFGA